MQIYFNKSKTYIFLCYYYSNSFIFPFLPSFLQGATVRFILCFPFIHKMFRKGIKLRILLTLLNGYIFKIPRIRLKGEFWNLFYFRSQFYKTDNFSFFLLRICFKYNGNRKKGKDLNFKSKIQNCHFKKKLSNN